MSGSTSRASTNTDAYAWIGPSGASWGIAANWQDITSGASPAAFVPGSLTPASIAGPTGSTYKVITAGGGAASLSVTGNVNLGGSYGIGKLAVGSRSLPDYADALYTAGAVALAAASRLSVTTLVVNSGLVTLTGAGASLAATDVISLGSASQFVGYVYDNGASGSLAINAGGTLAAAAALAVNQGTLSVTGAGSSGTIAGGVGLGAGGASRTAGFLGVSSGGRLAINGGLNELYGGVVVSGAGSRLSVVGTFNATAPAYYNAAPVGYFSLSATDGGSAQVGRIVVQGVAANGVLAAAAISVDTTGAIEVGTAGGAALGMITVDAGRSIVANTDAVLTGPIVNNGTINSAGGTLSLVGNVTGNGVVQIGHNATLMLKGNVAASESIVFTDTGAALVIGGTTGAAYTVAAPISGFATGDSIIMAGPQATSAVYTTTAAGRGTLSLFGGAAQLASLTLLGSYASENFFLSPTLAGTTSVTLLSAVVSGGPAGQSATANAYGWVGASGGSWQAAGNWQDLTSGANPVSFIPGAATPASIAGTTGSTFEVITGGGVAASLAVTGNVNLVGTYGVGGLALGARVAPDGADASYTSGVLSMAGGSSLSADTVVVSSGALSLSGAGASLAASGATSLGSAPQALGFNFDTGANGTLSVGNGASLAAGGALSINQGTLAVSGAATVAGLVSLGSGGTYKSAGFLSVSAGGTLTLADGLAETYGGVFVSGAGSRLSVARSFTATAPAYYNAAPFGSFSLAATTGGSVQLGSIVVQSGAGAAAISVDTTGAIEVGTAGGAALGMITVDAGRSIVANTDAVLTGPIVNNGTINSAGGTLSLVGNVTGNGVVQIGHNATLMLKGNVAASESIVFTDTGAALVIGGTTGAAYTVAAPISGFATGDSIIMAGPQATSAVYTTTAAGRGTLSLFGGAAQLASLTLLGSYASENFFLSPTLAGTTSVTLLSAVVSGGPAGQSATANAYGWVGASGGSWQAAGNWQDLTSGANPVSFIPGAATPASIAGTTGSTFEVITGGGVAASLAVTGNVNLVGTYGVGGLALGARVAPDGADASYTSGVLSMAGGSSLSADTVVVSSGALSLSGAGASLAASGATSLGSAPQALGFNFDTGANGTLSVGNGASLAAGGALSINQGTLAVSGAATVAGLVSLGSGGTYKSAGFLSVSAGGTLTLADGLAETYGGVFVSGAGSRLSVARSFTATAPAYYNAAPFGSFSLAATTGGSVQLGSIVVQSGAGAAAISVDTTGAIEVGTAGGAALGMITVDAGRSIVANTDAVLTGPIVNNGTINSAGGTLSLVGNVTGNGVVQIGHNATLMLKGNVAASESIVFTDTGAALVIGAYTTTVFVNSVPQVVTAPYTVSAIIKGFQTGDSLILEGVSAGTAVYTPTGGDRGTLGLFSSGTLIASLVLAGDYAANSFLLSPTTAGATSISLLAGAATPAILGSPPPLVGAGQSVTVGTASKVSPSDRLALVVDTPPAAGTLSMLEDGTIRYAAPAGLTASAGIGFTYHVNDNTGRSSPAQSATLTVNPGPSVRSVAVRAGTGERIDLTGRLLQAALPGIGGDRLTITAVGPAGSGTVNLSAGRVTYVGSSAATDSFTYSISDQLGTSVTALVRVLSPALTKSSLTVAAALASARTGTLPPDAVIADMAANVSAEIDALAALAHTGRIAAISLLDSGRGVIAIMPAQAIMDLDVLAIIVGPFRLAQRILAADAGTSELSPGFGAYAVTDSAAALAASLPAVEALWKRDLLAQIRLTDGGVPAIHLTADALVRNADALALVATNFTVALTDAGVPDVALSAWQTDPGLYANLLSRVTTPYSLSMNGAISPSSVASIETGSDRRTNEVRSSVDGRTSLPGTASLPGGLTVVGSARDITTFVGALDLAAQAGKLDSILLSGSGPQVLSLTTAQLTADGAAVSKVSPNHALSQIITASQAGKVTLDPRFTSITVQDTGSNIAANLEAIGALARAGQLARVLPTGTVATITLTAAQLSRNAFALSFAVTEGAVRFQLSDGGTPLVTLSADLLNNQVIRSAVLDAIIGPYSLAVTGPVSANTAAAVSGGILAALAGPLKITDTAANVTRNVINLAKLLTAGKLDTIDLIDAGALPALALSAVSAATYADLLDRITTPNAGVIAFYGSAAVFIDQLDALQALATTTPTASFRLSDPGTPLLTLTAAKLSAKLLALSRLETPYRIALSDAGTPSIPLSTWQASTSEIAAVLSRVVTPYTLSVPEPVSAEGAANLAGSVADRLATGGLAVVDAAAAVSNHLDTLAKLASLGKLSYVQLSDGLGASVPVTASQAVVDSGVLAAITTSHSLSLIVTAPGAASAAIPSGFTTLTVQDTATRVLANLAGLQALAAAGLLARITLVGSNALLISAASLSANALALSLIDSSVISLAGTGTVNVTLGADQLASAQIRAHVLARIATPFSLAVTGAVNARLAADLVAANAGLLTRLATPLAVQDGAQAVTRNLPALQTLATTGRLASIDLTDGGSPVVFVEDGMFAEALAKISGAHRSLPPGTQPPVPTGLVLTAADLVAQLDSLQARALAGELGAITLTDSGTPVLSLSAARLIADAQVVSLVTKPGGNFAVSLTDPGTPAISLPASVAASEAVLGIIARIAAPYTLTIAGSVTAAAAAGIAGNRLTAKLAGTVLVLDTADNVSRSLDGLQALAAAGRLAAVNLLDDASGIISVTQAQATADADALAAIATPYRLSLVTTAAAAANPLPARFTSLTVRDTVTNLLASLSQLAPLAASSVLVQVQLVGSTVVSLPVATLVANAAVLAKLGTPATINLTDPGPKTVTVTADMLSSAGFRGHVLDRIIGALSLVVTGPVSAATALALAAENGVALASLSAPITVLDSSGAVVAGLATLASLAAQGKLAAIRLTDGGLPTLNLTAAQVTAYAAGLAVVATPFIAGIPDSTVTISAASLLTQLDALQAKAATGALTRIILSDTGTPSLSLSPATFVADALALAQIVSPFTLALSGPGAAALHLTTAQISNHSVINLLGRLTTAYTLTLDGVIASDAATDIVAAGLVARLASPVRVVDTAAAIAAAIDTLQALAAAQSLGAVEVVEGAGAVLALTAAHADAALGAMAAITTPFTLSMVVTASAAASPAGRFTSLTVVDSAANVAANLASLEALAVNGALIRITTTDAASPNLSAATIAADIDALAIGDLTVTLADSTRPGIVIKGWQLTNGAIAALNRVVGDYDLAIDGAVRPVDAVRFLTVGGIAYANLANGSMVVRDDIAGILAHLSSLQAMAGKIASVEVAASYATLSLTPAQATADAAILAKMITPHALSQLVSAASLGSATLAAGFSNFTVADTAANIVDHLPELEAAAQTGLLGRVQPTDGSVFNLSAANLSASADLFALQDWGIFPITLTDLGTPVITVPSCLLGFNLRNNVLDAIAAPYRLEITGAVDARLAASIVADNNRVLANLATPLDVADANDVIAANIDALQTLAHEGKLGSVLAWDGAGQLMELSAGQLTADADALAKFTGAYGLNVTEVTAANAAAVLVRPHVASVSISDTAAHVAAALDTLDVLARAGKLNAVHFTDPALPSMTLTIQQQAADAAAIAKFVAPVQIETATGGTTGAQLEVQAYDWRSHALLSGVALSVLGRGDGASNISLKSVHVDAGRLVGELWVDGGGGVQNFSLTLALAAVGGAAATATFARGSALSPDWALSINTDPGQLSIAGLATGSTVAGLTSIGTFTITLPVAAQKLDVSLSEGEVGTVPAKPFILSYAAPVTGADGIATLTDINLDSYSLNATRGTADIGRAITSADALAALKVAVGLNPNLPVGVGGHVAAPMVSPYQLLAADVTGDGRVTAADAVAILKMAVRQAGALKPRWIFVDEANSTWDPATLKFISTRSSVAAAGPITAEVPATSSVNLVGVLSGAVLGRWLPLGDTGAALPPDRYALLPTSYFQTLSLLGGAPIDQWGYGAAVSASAIDATPVTSGAELPAMPATVYDTAASVAGALDRLQAWYGAGKLASVILMETTTPVLRLTVPQFANDTGALSTISGIYRLDLAAATNDATATMVGPAMSFVGLPDAVVNGTSAATIHYNLAVESGVETISGFRYAVDVLDVDLAGRPNGDLQVGDVLIGGQRAITVHAAGDGSHAVVLTGVSASMTAQNLLSQHLVFSNGHALIG